MKKALLAAIAVFLLLNVSAVKAQERHMMMAEDPGQAIAMMAAKIADTLQLTPDQKTQFDAIHSDLAATVTPLFQQSKAAHDQLRTLLNADNPDPTAVGQQAILAHNLEKQVQAAHLNAVSKIKAILTPEQKAKFDGFLSAGPMGMHAMAAPCSAHQ